jgi:SAM-dependent methyltransferase
MQYYGLGKTIGLMAFQLRNLRKEKFECPICAYRGPFLDKTTSGGVRRHAKCPNCMALERHRLQFLVLCEVLRGKPTAQWKMLHVAPEPFLMEFFKRRVGQYETADLKKKGVDYHVDLQHLPFGNGTYDFVFASHVLEHIPDDQRAISEIRRVLKPNGLAVLPVPIYSEKTVEYAEPDPKEFYHVRAPGLDYFDRYQPHFSRIEKFDSNSQPEHYQVFVYREDCSLSAEQGDKLSDVVPVCYV